MTTKLDKPVRREVTVGDVAYTLTIDPDGLKLVQKGHRKGDGQGCSASMCTRSRRSR